MNADDIERFLLLVAEELRLMNLQESIRLLLIGGGYMVTQVKKRLATGDIDMVWVYPEIDSSSEIYRLFKMAVGFIADDEDLNPNWLNTDAGDFLRAAGPLPRLKLWKKFGVLHVYLPPKNFILLINWSLAEEKIHLISGYFVLRLALILVKKLKSSWTNTLARRYKRIITLISS